MNTFLLIDGFYIFGLHVKFYGILMSLAFIIGVLIVSKLAKQKGFDSSIAFDLVLIAFPKALWYWTSYTIIKDAACPFPTFRHLPGFFCGQVIW